MQDSLQHLLLGATDVERRQIFRRRYRTRGMVRRPDGRVVRVQTLDASLGGVAVEHMEPFGPPGTEVAILLNMQTVDQRKAVFNARARVQHSVLREDCWHSGLQFVDPPRPSLVLLTSVLRRADVMGELASDYSTGEPRETPHEYAGKSPLRALYDDLLAVLEQTPEYA